MQTATAINNPPRLNVEKVSDGKITSLKFSGTINESFEGKKLAASVRGKTLVVNFSEVRKVSSFGIREWTTFMRTVQRPGRKIYFIRCAPKIVNQINIVADFVGKAHVFSFLAPYRCDHCDEESEFLLNLDRDQETIRKLKAPDQLCTKCGHALDFDEEPMTYFSYVSRQADFDLDEDTVTFLISKLGYSATDLARRIQFQKIVDEEGTYIRLTGSVDGTLPANQLAEGLEGRMILDVSGVGGMDPPGASALRRFLSLTKSTIERGYIVGCQPVFLERAIQPEDLGDRFELLSFSLPYQCERCGTSATHLIDVKEHFGLLKVAMSPEMKCGDCGGNTTCSASKSLLSQLTYLPQPTADKNLLKFIKRAQKRKAPAPAAPERAKGGVGRGTVAMLGVGLTAVAIAMVGVTYYQQQKGQKMVEEAVKQATLSNAQKRPEWITSDTPSSSYCTDLTNRTVCVGVSSFQKTKVAAQEEATDAALEALVHAVGLKIDNRDFARLFRKKYGPARRNALAELAETRATGRDSAEYLQAITKVRTARQKASESLAQSGGAAVPTQQSDWYWEEYKRPADQGNEFLAYVRFDVSGDAVAALTRKYAKSVSGHGLTAVTSFPSMVWPVSDHRPGAMILEVKKGPLARFGLVAMDTIVAVNDEPVADAESLVERLDRALKGGANKLKLRIRKADEQVIDLEREVGS